MRTKGAMCLPKIQNKSHNSSTQLAMGLAGHGPIGLVRSTPAIRYKINACLPSDEKPALSGALRTESTQ